MTQDIKSRTKAMRSSNHSMKLRQSKGSDDKRLNYAHKLPLQS